MKWAGYDLIIIRGKSERPVYLWIDDDHSELRDASHIWGQNTWVTEQIIREELKDDGIQTLKIGPAGENLCLSSCVIGNLSRAAARMGPGAIWGSKRLKAIAVRARKKMVNIAKPDEFERLCEELRERVKADPLYEVHTRSGNLGWVSDLFIEKACGGTFPNLMSTKFLENLYGEKVGCYNCDLQCRHRYTVKDGKYKGTVGDGLESNAIIFGGILPGIDDAAFICKYNTMCNQLGLNVDSPGAAIAWAMELYENGIITKEDTDGIVLTKGNQDAFLNMVHKIAYKEGFGEILDGFPLKAAERIGRGSEQYASHVKGAPGRGSGVEFTWEWTLGLAVATRGRDHVTGAPYVTMPGLPGFAKELTDEILRKLGEERYAEPKVMSEAWYNSPKKAQFVYDHENIYACHDMTGVCKFRGEMCLFIAGIHFQDFAGLLSAATGVDYTVKGLVKAAERELLLERAFNAREGIRRIDDHPFALYWKLKHGEPHPKYKYSSEFEKSYEQMLDEYYKLRGCDLKTGIPTRIKLEEVDLKDVADDLTGRGII
jgi:aldehyde:ferredoxin oxidoreductase